MKIKHQAIGVIMTCLGLVFTSGCVVDQYGRVWVAPPPTIVVAPPPPRVVIAQPPPSLWQKAERGDAVAQFTLGSCYANGRGVPRNYPEAVRWYLLAARQGYAPAQNRLGVCYYQGLGTPRNYAAAVSWYRRAAEQGNAAAQDNLGICYYSGRGVAQDFTEAARWYRLSAAQGDPTAAAHLDQLQTFAGRTPTAPRPPTPNLPPPTPYSPPAMPPPAAEPAPASSGNPITVDEIKALSSAGVKADTLTEQIKSTNSKFSQQDIAAAQQARVDPAVIECMKQNAR